MRVAVLILGLILAVVIFVQSAAIGTANALGDKSSSSGSAGFLVGVIFLIGAAFAIGVPRVSLVAFLLAAVIAIPVGASSAFSDLLVWGVVALALAAMSYFGHRERRRKKVQEDAGAAALQTLAAQHTAASVRAEPPPVG